MNKFYALMFVVLVAIFGGIFFVTQKDSVLNGMMKAATTPALPPDANSLKVVSLPPQQKEGAPAVQGETAPVPSFGVEEGIKASYSATLTTSKGDITLTLYGQDAPRTVKNFIDKAKSGYYKGFLFHRVEDWVVQGGDPKGDGTGGGVMQTEINSKPFVTGSLGVARRGDINVSNDSQFFVTKSEASWLNQQYTNFGMVTEGMDVVDKIKVGDKILNITVQ